MKLSAPPSLNAFLKRKNIELSFSRYALKAMSAMAQGLFCTLLIGTILKTIGTEAGIDFLMSAGSLAQSMAGPAMAAAMLVAIPVASAASWVGDMIMWGTELHPFIMGIVVSTLAGMALTLPISSAAICAGLGLTGLAGGAALAGCCAQMVGFAVMSFPENRWGGLVSQGIGTSMLQMGNILHNPKIWLPPIITSMITGPVATCIFRLEMNGAAVNSGMGTCGFCAPPQDRLD